MGEVWTVLKVLQWTTGYLQERGVDNGRLESELLLADTLGCERIGLYLNFDRPMTGEELKTFRERVGRRARREPLQYIMGQTEFWSLPFKVVPAVLIPRADTEVLVEEALRLAPESRRILDVGTGSGVIAVALAHELPEAQVEAVDVSREALAVAEENAQLNGVAQRVDCHWADMADLPPGPYDLIVSNPPYIETAELEKLMPEVRDHEPRQALDGGADGLICYRLLTTAARQRLVSGGWLVVEIGCDQATAVSALFSTAGFESVATRKDYAGLDRVVTARQPQTMI